MTQEKEILAFLQAGHTLTPLDALSRFGCFRLGARIYDLKSQGHDIQSQMIDVGGKRVKEYWLPVAPARNVG